MDSLMEKHSDLQAIVGSDDPETCKGAPVWQGPLFLESPLMAQVLTPDLIIEHAFMDCGDRYTSDEDTCIWDPVIVGTCGVLNTIEHTGYRMVRNSCDNASPR